MSQKTSVVNFLIHDANGQPQMVKVVQNTNNLSLTPIKLKPKPVKVYKVPTTVDENIEAPVYQPIKLGGIKCASKLVQVPVDTLARLQKNTTNTPSIKVENQQDQLDLNFVDTVPELVPIIGKSEVDILNAVNIKTEPSATMSHASRRRHDSDNDPPTEYTTKRRKHADKVGKGLRHFSMKVCEKVRNKGFTSYNEVADELVLEFAAGMHGSADSQQYDQKNIRRRVYDALNVLMAMNIISKEKKEIRWLGLPTNSVQECTALEKEKQTKIEQIQKKTQQLQELILQHISFKSLIERNKEAESKGVKPSPSSAIHLPFIVVNTSDKALIDCSISNDKSRRSHPASQRTWFLVARSLFFVYRPKLSLKYPHTMYLDEPCLFDSDQNPETEYMFNFNKRFQIHDDIDILKRMGLLFGLDKGECSEEDLEKVKSMVPKSLEYYVEQMGRGINTSLSNILEEDDVDEGGEEDEDTIGEQEADDDQEEADPNEYSEDSSDVDV